MMMIMMIFIYQSETRGKVKSASLINFRQVFVYRFVVVVVVVVVVNKLKHFKPTEDIQ